MPIYEYRCTECREEFETYVAGHATAVACRACASPNVTRKLSVFGLRAAGSFTPSSTMSTGGCCGGGCGCTDPSLPPLPLPLDLPRPQGVGEVGGVGGFFPPAGPLPLTPPTVSGH